MFTLVEVKGRALAELPGKQRGPPLNGLWKAERRPQRVGQPSQGSSLERVPWKGPGHHLAPGVFH